jgi:hypothetical protein
MIMSNIAIPENTEASLYKGLWFVFKDDDRDIAMHSSALSGQERIFVNGELVSKKRVFSLKSNHRFYFEGNTVVQFSKG